MVKKPEEINFAAPEVQQAQSTPSKPEVYFIKYKTQKGASGASGGGFSSGGSSDGLSSGGFSSGGSSGFGGSKQYLHLV